MAVLIILGVLVIALVVVLPLIERFGPHYNQAQQAKISRFIWPMVFVLLVAQLINHLFLN